MKFETIDSIPKKLPIFPLSGAVLFPDTQLPLNIFEPRYIQMVDSALASPNRLIGMIQPSSMESNGKGSLKKVGCIGRISSFNEAEDNRYLITLTGVCRFTVNEELDTTTSYRQVIADYNGFETDLDNVDLQSIDRSKLLALVKKYLENKKILADWEIIQQTPTKQIINYSGVLVPFSPEEKQLLLESKDLISRCSVLEALFQSYVFDINGEKSDRLH